MKLKEYLDAMDVPDREAFADRIGTSAAYLSNVARHHRHPSDDLSYRIVLETGGDVSLRDLRPALFGLPEHRPADRPVGRPSNAEREAERLGWMRSRAERKTARRETRSALQKRETPA